MNPSIVLLPLPRSLAPSEGVYKLTGHSFISINDIDPQPLVFCVQQVKTAIEKETGINPPVMVDTFNQYLQNGIIFRTLPDVVKKPQGYRLIIAQEWIEICGHDSAGVFYGVQTLIQIITEFKKELPCLAIEDWPDFPARGVMLDVSRDKVPTLETLLALVDKLASLKFNQVQLYTEHTFAYRDHPKVWEKASPITGEEILELDRYCRERFIELVPNQNSFGHLSRWLTLPEYAVLSEVAAGFDTPWGHETQPFSLCPEDPASFSLIQSLYDELLPYFSSRMVNVGCDETFDLGQGRSKAACAERGVGRVYLDFVRKIYHDLKRRGHTMQFWGDIILQYPDLVPDLPRDAVALEWGYEADHPFDQHGAQFAAAGVPFYVCPGTSSWNTIAGKTDNALRNLQNAAENGLKHGACGYLITDWGDSGHWQPLAVSYLGFAAGAAYSWCGDSNRRQDIREGLSRFVFQDESGLLSEVAYRLGNIYLSLDMPMENSSLFFHLLQQPLASMKERLGAFTSEQFDPALATIDEARGQLDQEKMTCPDRKIIHDEYTLVIRLLAHACQRGKLALSKDLAEGNRLRPILKADLEEIIDLHQQVWLMRNRPGGLEDSLAKFETAFKDYSG